MLNVTQAKNSKRFPSECFINIPLNHIFSVLLFLLSHDNLQGRFYPTGRPSAAGGLCLGFINDKKEVLFYQNTMIWKRMYFKKKCAILNTEMITSRISCY